MPYPTPVRTPTRYRGPVTRSRSMPLMRAAGGAVLRTAANAVPYGRAAYQAATAIQRAWRGYKQYQNRRTLVKKGTAPYHGVGTFQGKFKKGNKKAGSSMATKLGCQISVENHGNVSDPDLVVVGHNTFPIGWVSRAILMAILRKAFKKLGLNPTSLEQEIPGVAYNDAVGWRIELYYKNIATGSVTIDGYTTQNDATLKSIADQFIGNFEEFLFNFNSTNVRSQGVLERLTIHDSQAVGTYNRTHVDLNLMNEVVVLYVSSSLKVQNRTIAASAAGEDQSKFSTDRVDAQPIQGKKITFKGGRPVTKEMVMADKFDMKDSGWLKTTGADLGSYNHEPPVKSTFANAYAQSNVRLEPGHIKFSKLNWGRRAYLNNMKASFNVKVAGGGTVASVPGKCEIIGFEEVINSGSSNNITVNFEQQLFISAYRVTGRQPIIPTYSVTAAV